MDISYLSDLKKKNEMSASALISNIAIRFFASGRLECHNYFHPFAHGQNMSEYSFVSCRGQIQIVIVHFTFFY